MSAAEIYATVKHKNAAVLKDCSCTSSADLLAQLGAGYIRSMSMGILWSKTEVKS